MEQLGLHVVLLPASLAAIFGAHLLNRDISNHLAKLSRPVKAFDVAMPAQDAGDLPGVMGMHQRPRRSSRPLLGLLRHKLK
ncbi:hypothetical protein [Mesorhizobium sp. B2-8-9]|uniref:hypothetical protein n=1 Tax=Mesorhizobium sp. B2-8-9 TaxID=2589899 RepID=UPI00112CD9F8|nr:hypothetical protein [Mesorhizobium sp. B2-8-9]TPI72572.1 hypothetical protein FJ423_27315 [Mesorhizobium sp. B2-8-9]